MKANRFNFRAWHPKNKTMVTFYFEDLHDDANCMRHFGLLASDKHPAGKGLLMQSTGLTDKNGVEIFEGDVLITVALSNDHGQRGATTTCTVRAFMGNSCLCLGFEEMGVPIFPFNVDHTIQILGNIHENPELVSA